MEEFTRGLETPGLSNLLSPGLEEESQLDTSEQIRVSSLTLLKMLIHGRSGAPLEVTGMLLGKFVDNYTITVVDCYPIPQKGTGVSVESFDEIYQRQMMDLLKRTGRHENMVGWYHSHPGFGCWLSGVDINTAQTVEAMDKRAISVVVDPIQSVKGKLVIDAFRTISHLYLGGDQRQTTSNLGHLKKPSIQSLLHGLNRHYYSIDIDFRTKELEYEMLKKFNTKKWSELLNIGSFKKVGEANLKAMEDMRLFAEGYAKALEDEEKLSKKELAIKNIGEKDPKRHLEMAVDQTLSSNVVRGMKVGLTWVIFK